MDAHDKTGRQATMKQCCNLGELLHGLDYHAGSPMVPDEILNRSWGEVL